MSHGKVTTADPENLLEILVNKIPHLRLDQKIAERLCAEMAFRRMLKILHDFGDTLTLREFVDSFLDKSSVQRFMVEYLKECEASVIGKAQCKCTNRAENGVPCEHDLALLQEIR